MVPSCFLFLPLSSPALTHTDQQSNPTTAWNPRRGKIIQIDKLHPNTVLIRLYPLFKSRKSSGVEIHRGIADGSTGIGQVLYLFGVIIQGDYPKKAATSLLNQIVVIDTQLTVSKANANI